MHRHDTAHLIELATRVFGDRESARHWLDRPSLQLGGRSPRELLGEEKGCRRVEELLAQIDDDARLRGGGA
jgi:putative toxin-antitoxin system antitoxin component (TIGR02293 family)